MGLTHAFRYTIHAPVAVHVLVLVLVPVLVLVQVRVSPQWNVILYHNRELASWKAGTDWSGQSRKQTEEIEALEPLDWGLLFILERPLLASVALRAFTQLGASLVPSLPKYRGGLLGHCARLSRCPPSSCKQQTGVFFPIDGHVTHLPFPMCCPTRSRLI